jgi:hypothetical protein
MANGRNTEKNLMPLLITSMAVIAPLLFFLGLVVGNQLQGNGSLSADSLSSWLSAIATVAIAVLTFILAKETWYLREAQIDQLEDLKRENIRPNVGVQLESSQVDMNFINVKISNLGKGIARKISFTFLDRQGNQVTENQDVVVDKFLKLGIFRLGIESMGIGQIVSSYVFSFIDLGRDLKGEIFKPYLSIAIKFEDIEGTPYTNTFAIDFTQFEGTSELGSDPSHKIATDIQKIRESIEKVAGNSNRRIGVDVYSSSDRHDEAEETRKWIEEQRVQANS